MVACGAATAQASSSAGRGGPGDLPAGVLKTLRQAQVPPSALSVLVAPVPADTSTAQAAEPRLSHHPHNSVNPASVMKLFTTYAALSLLGPDHTWRNRVYTDGPVRDGVLHGNLIVRGSGDPKLVMERLQALLVQVQAAGVREVRGDMVLDRSVFDVRERSEPFDDEPLRPYNVGPDGFLLNFKAVIYKFTPDPANGHVQVRFEPPLAGLSVTPQLPLTSTPCSDWRRQVQADFSQPLQVRFAGGYPASCGGAGMARGLSRARPIRTADAASHVGGCRGTTERTSALRDPPDPCALAAGGAFIAPVGSDQRHQQVLQQRDGPTVVPVALERDGGTRAL